MRQNHTPYFVHALHTRWNEFLVRHYFSTHFDHLGHSPSIVNPLSAQVFGDNIEAGDYLNLASSKASPVKLTTWKGKGIDGRIRIGNYCLLSPGTTISAAQSIEIGDNCMFAGDCYISDSDWHGLYNRLRPFRCTRPIVLKENVWVGHGAKIGKGVTIGENSVVAAGAIVVKDVPANVVVGGNPARVIKTLNPKRRMLKREFLFQQTQGQDERWAGFAKLALSKNTWLGWVRSILLPNKSD